MRLGGGTGAALAAGIVNAIHRQMATISEAKVADKH